MGSANCSKLGSSTPSPSSYTWTSLGAIPRGPQSLCLLGSSYPAREEGHLTRINSNPQEPGDQGLLSTSFSTVFPFEVVSTGVFPPGVAPKDAAMPLLGSAAFGRQGNEGGARPGRVGLDQKWLLQRCKYSPGPVRGLRPLRAPQLDRLPAGNSLGRARDGV